ncbi:MAG: hypothetical protein P8L37_08605, partial [Phycisphaerales bacterium]|nr:hypothetical protein [Phycisphaerales bacterium]
MKIVQYVALAVLAMIPLSAFSGPADFAPMHIVTTVAMGGPSNSVPASAIAKIAMGGPSNTAPLSAVTKVAMGGPSNTAPLSAVTKAAMGGPAGTTVASVISRAVLGGPIEDLIRAVIAASGAFNEWALEQSWSDGYAGNHFGSSVALDGDWMLIGSSGSSDNNGSGGTVRLYEYDGVDWSVINSWSDGYAGNHFGSSVALDGDRMLIGSAGSSDNNGSGGTVRLYEYDGVEWLVTDSWSDGYAGNHFGRSVALDGDRMLIGSSGSSDNNGSGGTVRLYEYDGVDWSV